MPRLGILAGDFVFSHSLGRNSPARFQYGNGDFQYIPEVASGSLNVLFETASSTDRRNTRIKKFCRCFKSKRLAWPLI
jgi:hypothetical protein